MEKLQSDMEAEMIRLAYQQKLDDILQEEECTCEDYTKYIELVRYPDPVMCTV